MISGSSPTFPTTLPAYESDLVRAGSRFVPIAIKPPGVASFTDFPAVINESTVVVILSRFFLR